MMKKTLYLRTLEKLSELVSEWGKADVFLVGGCIRDSIIETGIEDIDLVVDMNNGPEEFTDWLRKEKRATDFIVLPRHDTIRFTLIINEKEVQVECVTPRTNFDDPNSNHLLDDALKRDFCCNAIYKNAITGELIDPTKHGIEDAEKRILRTPISAEQTFLSDPLRMLRAFRFKADKKFQILPEVYQYIKPYPEYFQVKIERVREEFKKILKAKRTPEIIRELHTTKLLSYIIPELEEAWGFNQNTHFHSMNLTDYTLNVLDNLWKNDDLVKMAALLHDISKYKEWKVTGNGEFSYPGHEKKSAEMAENIMERLKYSKDDIRVVRKIIENHKILKPYYDPLSGRYNGTQKVTRRIVRELGDELNLCLSLINATNISHAPSYNKPLQVRSFIFSLNTLGRVPILKGCPVSGNDIMREFGLTPGPKIGEVKDIMMDWLDETPELGKEELIEKFKQEYGGKTFWVCKNEDYGEIEVTFSEPIFGKDGKLTTVPYEIPFVLLDLTLKEEKEMWRAEEHPKLFSAVIKFKKSRELFEEAAKLLNGLRQIEGFMNVTLSLDDYGDLSGRIDWKDLKSDYIF